MTGRFSATDLTSSYAELYLFEQTAFSYNLIRTSIGIVPAGPFNLIFVY